MSHRIAVRAAAAALGAALAVPGVAAAQDAVSAKTVTAIGTSEVPINQHVAKTNAAVRAAIERSQVKAGPLAIQLAQQEAQRLAAAAGLTLGALQSIAEVQPSPFGGQFTYGLTGTIGPGKWCGQLMTSRLVTRNGKRRRTFSHHYGCRIPREASQIVSATFLAG
jgi:hypothetical protein